MKSKYNIQCLDFPSIDSLNTNFENELVLNPAWNTMARIVNGTNLTIPVYEPTY
jgi:hypothetical protein